MIPLVDGNERVDLLHPVLRARVAALCADPRVAPHLKVESAARTYAEQRYLYDGWRRGLPGFNLAADPDRRISPAYGLADPRGSWHMQQSDGHAYAVDFNYSALPAQVQAILEDVAHEHMLARTVPSEAWHYQMVWGDWWTTPVQTPEPEDDMTDDEHVMLAEVYRQLVGKPYKAGQKVPRPIRDAVGDTLDLLRAVAAKVSAKVTRSIGAD